MVLVAKLEMDCILSLKVGGITIYVEALRVYDTVYLLNDSTFTLEHNCKSLQYDRCSYSCGRSGNCHQ